MNHAPVCVTSVTVKPLPRGLGLGGWRFSALPGAEGAHGLRMAISKGHGPAPAGTISRSSSHLTFGSLPPLPPPPLQAVPDDAAGQDAHPQPQQPAQHRQPAPPRLCAGPPAETEGVVAVPNGGPGRRPEPTPGLPDAQPRLWDVWYGWVAGVGGFSGSCCEVQYAMVATIT